MDQLVAQTLQQDKSYLKQGQNLSRAVPNSLFD